MGEIRPFGMVCFGPKTEKMQNVQNIISNASQMGERKVGGAAPLYRYRFLKTQKVAN